MKKLILPLCLLLLSCSENDISEKNDNIENTNSIDEVIDTKLNTKNAPTAGSNRALLIGKWMDVSDESVIIEIKANKYLTYINGKKNWDQDWDLSTKLEISDETISDDGSFIQVYSEGQVFYIQRIVELTETHLSVFIEKQSGGGKKNKEFIRI